ncbi:hypothetical protein [Frederiksenia canicola]|uniref:Uncharacterized protein n=1 Tax=Frederiksenia canicola TaxID=123824 RepID=A0AAE6X698_9PAST|nr:hypothetical protein [Frederiksenia canicola]QIM65635.1 hypothetical protein A4G17_09355 [Frederiksenia canicola]RPE95907.1 hypothetical protein EDC49_0285 [Frederiksenia canicola]
MNKIIVTLFVCGLCACSTPPQQSSVPMDMKAVEEYQQKIASGKTVGPATHFDDSDLNHSDRKPKVQVYHHYERVPVLVPHIGYERAWGNPRSGGSIGIGFGGFY